jgi:hypothetical protein
MLFIWEVEVEDRVGRPTSTSVVATAAALACSPPTSSEPLQTIVAPAATDLIGHVESSAHEWRLQVAEARRGFVDARLARERAIQSSIDSQPRASIQPGLFDGRADRTQAGDRAALEEMADAVAQRIALLESSACVGTTSRPRLRLILLPQR